MITRSLKSLSDLDAIRHFWEKWQHHPNSDFSHFQLICKMRKEVIRPHIVVVEDGGQICSLIVARLEKNYICPRIGYFKILRIPSTVLNIIHEGLIGHIDEAIAKEVASHLFSILYSKEADVLVFNQLREGSPLLDAIMNHRYRWLRERKPQYTTHRQMELPQEQGFILKRMKSKHRSWIRGREKKMISACRGDLRWKWLTKIYDIEGLCRMLEEVAALTYQRGLGAGFIDDDEHRNRFELFNSRGQMRMQLLEIKGKIRAFWIGTLYNGVFHSSETAYDPALREYEPGTLIYLHMVDELVKERVEKFDFGLGDAHYKERFGNNAWDALTIRIFSPTVKGLTLKVLIDLFGFLDSATRRILRKTGFFDSFKTRWRRHIAQGTGNNKSNYLK